MDNINRIIKKAQDDLFPELESKIRAELEKKDKDWLIDQIIYLTCERHSLHEQKADYEQMKKRLTRIKTRGYNDQSITHFITSYKQTNRTTLEQEGYLIQPPHLGLACIEPHQRTKKGEVLLEEAQDMLYIALYGDSSLNVNLSRGQEEILTMTLPLEESDVLNFLKAVTQFNETGTWKDPEGISNDEETPNIGLQVEFSNSKDGCIGDAIFIALNLINLLQVNEQIFYARLEKVERSSLEL